MWSDSGTACAYKRRQRFLLQLPLQLHHHVLRWSLLMSRLLMSSLMSNEEDAKVEPVAVAVDAQQEVVPRLSAGPSVPQRT